MLYLEPAPWCEMYLRGCFQAIPRGFFGIVATQPGYMRFTCKPQPGPVEEAQIVFPTHSGLIKASFTQQPGTSFSLQLTPPANTLAKVCLPKLGSSSMSLDVDGAPTAGYAQGDYVCVEGIGSAADGTPRHITRSS
jgi:hypothetical protein